MTDLPTIRTALEDSYAAIETLGAGLSTSQWETRSLCPEWTVRGVVDHVVGIEAALASWSPDGPASPPPFERASGFVEETSGLEGAAFMTQVREVFDRRRLDLAALSPGDLQRPSWTPVGPGTYGRFMELRVFDLWVHERDITTPLGRPTDDTGARAEIALGEVEGSLGYIVGKKVGLPDGRSIVFHLSGPLQAAIWRWSSTGGPRSSRRWPSPTSRCGRTR